MPHQLLKRSGACSTSSILWICASVQLPDDETTVLIALSDGEVWTGYMEAGQWFFVSGDLVDQGSGTRVCCWADFPEPPSDNRYQPQ